MKGKILVACLITMVVIIALVNKGYLDPKNKVEVSAYVVKFNCGESNIDLRVTSVSDSAVNFLIGKTVSPELTFAQTRLNQAIDQLMQENNGPAAEEFLLVGYIRKSDKPHCSGSTCFQVKKIKRKSANTFIEF